MKQMATIRFWHGLAVNLAIESLIHLLERAVRKDFLQSICKDKDDHLIISVDGMDNFFPKSGSARRLIGHSHFQALESPKVVF